MGRSFFQMGFGGDPFLGAPTPGMTVGPLTLKETKAEIEAAKYKPLMNLKLPAGYVTAFPYVVKIGGNTGEYLVYADGTAQYSDYGSGRVGAPFRIK